MITYLIIHIHIISMIRTSISRRFSLYLTAHRDSISNPAQYWSKQAQTLTWGRFPSKILDDTHPPFYRWFPDGMINITEQCLDRHLSTIGDQVAYYIESPLTHKSSQITYKQLHHRVSKFADSLSRNFKVTKGDRVVIYMPMIIQSIIAKLACARIGAIHSVVFGGFSAHELASRIEDCKPKVIICGNAGKQPNKIIDYLDIVENALEYSKHTQIPRIIMYRDLIPHKHKYAQQFDFLEVEKGGSGCSPLLVESTHPLYILYTSGTTGAPKGIVRDQGGTSVILSHTLKNIFGLEKGDGMFCSSDIGWVLGHSYITYAPLIGGLRSVLFEGKPVGTPDSATFWKIIEKHKINHLYTSPTAIRTIRKEDPNGHSIAKHNVKSLTGITVVGERCDVSCFNWMVQHFPNIFVNENYWQTETGAPIITNYLGKTWERNPSKPGSACKPFPGYNVTILNSQTLKPCKPGQTGIIFIKTPMPPSFMLTMWQKDQAYVDKYFATLPGYYNTGDSGYYDADGYFYIMSRIDDVINTAGHRLSTGEMEEVLLKNNKVAEAIVIGAKDEVKGQVPVGFVTLKSGVTGDHHKIAKQLVALIREQIGPVASFKICHVVNRLPKTRSGKYIRNIVRKMCNGEQYKVPSTVQDMEPVKEIEEYIKKHHHHH